MNDAEDDLELADGEAEGLVPYAPDFTPATLGKGLGEDHVLPWLLTAAAASTRPALLDQIAATCLAHVANARSRRDMASHVFQGLQNYLLVIINDDGSTRLTSFGERLRVASAGERDGLFGRHILTMCNGYRLVEAIQRYELRGKTPTLEGLTEELDRSATSKSLSTMKAWLQRAGVLNAGQRYSVNEHGLESAMGVGAKRLLGLSPAQVELLLAARIMELQQGPLLEAADVKMLAEQRRPDVRLPGKTLGKFVKGLVEQGLLIDGGHVSSRGGRRVAFRLAPTAHELTDEQVRSLVAQAQAGMLLSDMRSLTDVMAALATGNADTRGRLGEMLAVHACLMLGLRVLGWRSRSPVEVDLVADRVSGLTYQRWHIQVKNVDGDLDSDRVDREVGAAVGTGATHILFVVPRGGATSAARGEMNAKSRLTALHVYALTDQAFASPVLVSNLLRELTAQEAHLTRLKRLEAERRTEPL